VALGRGLKTPGYSDQIIPTPTVAGRPTVGVHSFLLTLSLGVVYCGYAHDFRGQIHFWSFKVKSDFPSFVGVGVFLLGVAVFAIGGLMYGIPQYNIYCQRAAGAAKLAEAESSRQILIAEASAKEQAAGMLAKAGIRRAEGVAEENRIIGESLKGNEEYLRFLWIQNLEAGNNSVIYIPTEAGLPILEAGKRAEK
jgi:hypothetical protein